MEFGEGANIKPPWEFFFLWRFSILETDKSEPGSCGACSASYGIPMDQLWLVSERGGEKMDIVDVEPVLGQFSAHKGKAVRAYEQYVLDHMGGGHRGEFYKVEDQRFLGSEGFSARIQRGAKEKVEHIYEISLGDMANGVEMGFGIPASVIRGMSRNRIGASGRSIVGYQGRRLAGYPLSSIADYFRRDPVSLCQGIAKVEKRMREEDGFREKPMALEKNLGEGRKRKIKK